MERFCCFWLQTAPATRPCLNFHRYHSSLFSTISHLDYTMTFFFFTIIFVFSESHPVFQATGKSGSYMPILSDSEDFHISERTFRGPRKTLHHYFLPSKALYLTYYLVNFTLGNMDTTTLPPSPQLLQTPNSG